jgi:hypothetical protein
MVRNLQLYQEARFYAVDETTAKTHLKKLQKDINSVSFQKVAAADSIRSFSAALSSGVGWGLGEGHGGCTVRPTKSPPCCREFGRSSLTLKLSFAFGHAGLKQIDFSQLALVNGWTDQSAASTPPTLATLRLTSRRATTHHLRDGEVVLYMRPDSGVWQVRYKLLDRRWRCRACYAGCAPGRKITLREIPAP